MIILNALIPICFVLLILLGIFLFIYSIVGFAKRNSDSQLKLPGIGAEIRGPAWLMSTIVGAILVASPILFASYQVPGYTTIPPPPAAVRELQKIEDPTYTSFKFIRDLSILDLRPTVEAPWYSSVPVLKLLDNKKKVKPAILKNYMTIRKISAATHINMKYSTSGKLDLRCPTHQVSFNRAETISKGKVIESWEVIADVSTVPVGQEFEMLIEATYWNAFSGEDGDDYSTYAHNQTEPEELSIILLFPEEKPFKRVDVTEYSPQPGNGSPAQGQTRSWPGPKNETFYWSILSTRPEWYYKIAWKW